MYKIRHYLRQKRWRGARVLSYVDDFLFFASSHEDALQVRLRLDTLLDMLGLICHPTKGFSEPTQFGHHFGINIDSRTRYFFTPADKLLNIST
jgi:hypothetical protein